MVNGRPNTWPASASSHLTFVVIAGYTDRDRKCDSVHCKTKIRKVCVQFAFAGCLLSQTVNASQIMLSKDLAALSLYANTQRP